MIRVEARFFNEFHTIDIKNHQSREFREERERKTFYLLVKHAGQ